VGPIPHGRKLSDYTGESALDFFFNPVYEKQAPRRIIRFMKTPSLMKDEPRTRVRLSLELNSTSATASVQRLWSIMDLKATNSGEGVCFLGYQSGQSGWRPQSHTELSFSCRYFATEPTKSFLLIITYAYSPASISLVNICSAN